MTKIKLYDKTNMFELRSLDMVPKYLKNIIEKEIKIFIDNCNAKFYILKYENYYLPIVVAENDKNQTYLVSLISSYIEYPKHILKNCFINIIFNFFSKIMDDSSIDKVVYVNHWLISTNIHYDLSAEQINEVTKFIKQKFPDYAICFRNIAKETNEILYNALNQNKYRFLINRTSYYIDNNSFKEVYKKQSIKTDLSLCKKRDYQIADNVVDIAKQVQLYNDLYINKYTCLNPQYNEKFFDMLKDNNFENYTLLNKQDEIVGFYIPFVLNNTVSVPWFGYDTSVMQNEGLYRLLMLNIIEYAKNNNLNLNLSSGVGEYKQRRGAKQYWEYLAIDYSHLNIFRKFIFSSLIFITNKISFPLAKLFNIKFF